MNIALPMAFAFAAFCSIAAIWQAIASNADAILELRRKAGLSGYGSLMTVTFREHLGEFDAISAVRRSRQVRVPAPKRVTHRLHQFAKGRAAA